MLYPRGTSLPRRPMHTTNVLLVDDDPATCEMFRQALRLSGFIVRTAADGVSALAQVDEQRPDVIVLDLDLPQISGLDVHDELLARADTATLPIIVVTGTDWQPRNAPFAVLRKPISTDRLIAMITRAASARLQM